MTQEVWFLRLEFRGERFTDGLIPVSALPEIQRITEAIQKTALRESPKQEAAHIDPVLSFIKKAVLWLRPVFPRPLTRFIRSCCGDPELMWPNGSVLSIKVISRV